jgi:serine/threonine protein kinase
MARYPQPSAVVLGKFRIESLIGEGGMGAVLKARHLELDEPVAIKVLLPDYVERQDIVQRFMREGRAAVKLKNEHVARVLDVGRLEGSFAGTPYIVMEYLDGADLNAIIKHHGAQDPQVAVDLILQACEAIAEAHSLGIIHRDIKASNFFICQPEGQPPHLKVLDFGIATEPKGTSDLTNTQSVIGTPAYMAPEQMRSSRAVDARSDIWSIGVVLYELLEGKRPFRSEAYSDLCLKVGMDPPEPFAQTRVPDGLQFIVQKCLEKSVERRYQSVAELAFDLMPFASDPVLARASVEQCARLLGRRGMRTFDIARAADDTTPAPLTPARITPASAQLAVPDVQRTPTGAKAMSGPVPVQSTRRTALTPVPAAPSHKTPTSINSSNGQMQTVSRVDVRPSRRGLVIGLTAACVIVGGGAIVYTQVGMGGGSERSSGAAAAPAAAPDPTPVVAPPPPVKEPVKEVAKEPVKEVAKEPVKELAKQPPAKEPVATAPTKEKPPVVVQQKPIAKTPPRPPLVAKKPPAPPPRPPEKKDKDPKPPPTGDDIYIKRQ